MIRVRCYYRYSSDEQSDGWSIDAQDHACRNFIAAKSDWEIAGKPYLDEAWSGKTVHHADAVHVVMAYELCAAGKTDAVIADALNRAGARTYRLIDNAKKKAGADIEAASADPG